MAKECRRGYRRVGDVCKKIKRGVFNRSQDGVTQPSKNVRYVIIAFLFVLAFILVINISVYSTVKPLLISILFFILSFVIYSVKEFQDDLIGIELKRIPKSIFFGVLFAVGFHLITRFVPFLTLAYPVYPASIGENFEFFLVNIVSPVSESVFFIGGIFAFFRNFASKNGVTAGEKYLLIFLVSLLFSFWHLGAYIFAVYALDIGQASSAFFSNITAFISAFVFNFLIMTIGLLKGVSKADQTFMVVGHGGINILRSAFSVIKFVV